MASERSVCLRLVASVPGTTRSKIGSLGMQALAHTHRPLNHRAMRYGQAPYGQQTPDTAIVRSNDSRHPRTVCVSTHVSKACLSLRSSSTSSA